MNAATHTSRTATTSVVLDPCAKINLSLEVIGRRSDGFHEMRSIAIGVDVRDGLRLSRSQRDNITIACEVPELAGPSNLAVKAVSLMAQRFALGSGLHIELAKRIPIGSGLGGGSADAAAALSLCNDLCRLGLDRAALQSLGAEIGSDVPLFFDLPGASVSGRGEIVSPVRLTWRGCAMLVFTGAHVSTPEVYGAWTPHDASHSMAMDPSKIISADTALELNERLVNQLEPAVFRVAPAVAEVFEELHRLGHGPLRVSGAGSVFYKLFDDKNAAHDAADKVAQTCSRVTTMIVAAPVAISPLRIEGEMNGNH